MATEPPDWVRHALSPARFSRYLATANNDVDAALRLYQWNLDVSSAFYAPLHWLEVGLRNALHGRLRDHFEREDWWSVAPLSGNGQRKVGAARTKISRRRRAEPSADDVVAELSFGFWVSLVSRGRNYDRTFWVPALHKAFPHYSGARSALHLELSTLLDFRNRIMHHEPIHHRDPTAYRDGIYRLLGYFAPAVVERVRELDRIPAVLERRGLTRGDDVA
jgi:hypothetical protein